MEFGTSVNTFLSLVRAGLWENCDKFQASGFRFQESVDWEKVYQLAEEQSVIGLVLAGIETSNVRPPKKLLLQWIGEVQMLEQQNKAMNMFIAELIEKMRNADIYTLLVKGQGIAQCYERPLWRACGDVDLLLSDSYYEKAKKFLKPLASEVESERLYAKHLGMTIDGNVVELHGRLTCGLTTGIDKQIDKIQDAVFYGGEVRSWQNGETQVFLPGADNDVIFVFTHFLKHFYKEGLGLRQICDWCRLMWVHRDEVDVKKIEGHIRQMGLISEWKAFYALASKYLGMPDLDSRFMCHDSRFDKKADRIMEFVMMSGNMGHNRDMSHFSKRPYLLRKCISMGRRVGDLMNHARIFPLSSLRFFPRIMFNGVRSAMRGE